MAATSLRHEYRCSWYVMSKCGLDCFLQARIRGYENVHRLVLIANRNGPARLFTKYPQQDARKLL